MPLNLLLNYYVLKELISQGKYMYKNIKLKHKNVRSVSITNFV